MRNIGVRNKSEAHCSLAGFHRNAYFVLIRLDIGSERDVLTDLV